MNAAAYGNLLNLQQLITIFLHQKLLFNDTGTDMCARMSVPVSHYPTLSINSGAITNDVIARCRLRQRLGVEQVIQPHVLV